MLIRRRLLRNSYKIVVNMLTFSSVEMLRTSGNIYVEFYTWTFRIVTDLLTSNTV